eukprot:TRINITY_DN16857_c0_g1_i1.p1 TRINITY_DN16857_c0_g1~~TRINITY_DN16857_c0_g1_i1.p1  ORF type:complete len:608 (+),score=120.36 TRINITY_DN16857_c0_g1_i1:86-1909(+)
MSSLCLAEDALEPLKQIADLRTGFMENVDNGILNIADADAIRRFAAFLRMDEITTKSCVDGMDLDNNGYVSFAEFALWADRHTASISLGLDVPQKENWYDGMPKHWAMEAPTPTAEEPRDRSMDSSAEFVARCHQLIDLAKSYQWDRLFTVLKVLPPEYVNYRPDQRRFGIIHQAAYAGSVSVLERLLDIKADVTARSGDSKTAYEIAQNRGHSAAADYLESKMADSTVCRGPCLHALLNAAKESSWEEVWEILDNDKTLVNDFPDERRFAVIHHAAYAGNELVLQKLVDIYKADVQLRTHEETPITALQVALQQDNERAAVYLQSVMPALFLHDEFISFPTPKLVRVEDERLLSAFGQAVAQLHKPGHNWTRDRQAATDGTTTDPGVPTGYQFVAAFRNENAALWRMYQINREIIKKQCQTTADFRPFQPWADQAFPHPYARTAAFDGLEEMKVEADANEWLLLHASIPEALKGISETGFKMAKVAKGADSEGGGLYGEGGYFTDCLTKADEYARKKITAGEFEGCRTAAIVRVTGGHHLYAPHRVEQEDKKEFRRLILSGTYHSVLGDRLRLKNTFREYVIFSAAQCYLEYIFYYKRLGLPDEEA